MVFDTIKYEIERGIGVITLNRPKVYNAINAQCRKEMESVLDDTGDDKGIRVLIITGHENFFCAGADINEFMGMTDVVSMTAFSRNFQRLYQKIEDFRKPVIAAVSGFALGGGCELALSCDLIIMSESASFGVPEIDIGAFPAGGGTQKLPRLLGVKRAKQMLFTGERISAQESYRIGIANKIVPNGACLDEAKAWAEKLVSKSPSAITTIKRLVNVGLNMDMNSALAFEAENFGTLSTHRDFKEGMSAFLEKRKPKYQGD